MGAITFAYAPANLRPDPKLGELVSQSVARIQMMSHQMSQPFENLPCSPDFHDTLLAPLVFIHSLYHIYEGYMIGYMIYIGMGK